MQNDLLFVYGTLLDKDNEFGAYLSANSVFISEGEIRGRLYDLGEYPAAVVDDREENFVYGKIYQLRNAADIIEALDDYEGIGDANPKPNEYKREQHPIETNKGDTFCWIYLYNLDSKDLKQITSGRY